METQEEVGGAPSTKKQAVEREGEEGEGGEGEGGGGEGNDVKEGGKPKLVKEDSIAETLVCGVCQVYQEYM